MTAGAQKSFDEFRSTYMESVREVLRYWTSEMQQQIAEHCWSWAPARFDFNVYLERSVIRFYKAYLALAESGPEATVCDVGGFWGVFPMTLQRLGYRVTMTESLQYYGECFNGLFQCLRNNGVRIADYDPFQQQTSTPGKFDLITVMAVIEHYPHSLAVFMQNMKALMNRDSKLYIEVPNIAYWPKRMGLLKGVTPQADVLEILNSKVPFIGHHHEFTIGELRRLAGASGLAILREDFYNYSSDWPPTGLKSLLGSPIRSLAFAALKDARECLAVTCALQR